MQWWWLWVYLLSIVPANRSYTVAIIKPDVVAHGKTNEIIMKVKPHNITKVVIILVKHTYWFYDVILLQLKGKVMRDAINESSCLKKRPYLSDLFSSLRFRMQALRFWPMRSGPLVSQRLRSFISTKQQRYCNVLHALILIILLIM